MLYVCPRALNPVGSKMRCTTRNISDLSYLMLDVDHVYQISCQSFKNSEMSLYGTTNCPRLTNQPKNQVMLCWHLYILLPNFTSRSTVNLTSVMSGFKYMSCGWPTTQWAYLLSVQHVIERTRAFLSDKQLIKYGINSGRCGIMPFIQPSAMAPSTRIPDSLISQLSWNRISLRIGSRIGRMSSRNTLARTSNAAAEHFPVE